VALAADAEASAEAMAGLTVVMARRTVL